MILGQVVGSVVATQKEQNLTGKKLLIVKSINLEGNMLDSFLVAVDIVGVGNRRESACSVRKFCKTD